MKKTIAFLLLLGLLLAGSRAEAKAESTPQSAGMASTDLLRTNSWQWVSFTNPVEIFEIETPKKYTLTFNKEGTVSIAADCNNAIGNYTIDGSSLTITLGPMTMAACPPESRGDQFVHLLSSAAIYSLADGNLQIDLIADGGTMVFAPAGENAMIEDDEQALANTQPQVEPLQECFSHRKI